MGTPDGPSSGDEEEYLPPCRAAGRYVAPCPRCGRRVTMKTLRYSHVCGRNFDEATRAREQYHMAIKALNARVGGHQERPQEHPQVRTVEQRVAEKRAKWAALVQ